MKIVIDAYQAAQHITGSDRLADNMLRELQNLDQDNEYVILTNSQFDFISSGITAPNFTTWPVKVSRRPLWLTFRLPLLLRQLKADVFYSFHNLSSPGFKACYTMVSLLDMIPVEQPDLYFGSSKRTLRRFIVTSIMHHSVNVADQFTAISEYSKSVAVSKLGLDPAKVKVIYLQADPQFFSVPTAEKLSAATERYKLPAKYVMTIGASEPRKNVVSVIAAHQSLPTSLRKEFPLVIVGAKWHNREVEIKDDEYIRLTGFVADEDLPSVYKLAAVFAFPSTYEGFGLPVLEAMANGVPVIASKTTSLPEVCGEAAIMVDPLDIEKLSSAMKDLLESNDRRKQAAQAGLQQVKNFSWSHSAQQLRELIQKGAP